MNAGQINAADGPKSGRTWVRRRPLVKLAASSSATVASSFRVTVPDPRIRAHVRLIKNTSAGNLGTADADNTTARLWCALTAQGPTGKNLPVTNLVGTLAAGLAIPTDTGLYGHAFQVEALGQDAGGNGQSFAAGTLTVTGSGSGVALTWTLEVVWQANTPITDAEWSAISARLALTGDEVSG
jgi:hypothetical protein